MVLHDIVSKTVERAGAAGVGILDFYPMSCFCFLVFFFSSMHSDFFLSSFDAGRRFTSYASRIPFSIWFTTDPNDFFILDSCRSTRAFLYPRSLLSAS